MQPKLKLISKTNGKGSDQLQAWPVVGRVAELGSLCNHNVSCYNPSITKVEKLERDIATLSSKELAEFRRWYTEFDGEAWDRQIDADAQSGAFDGLADEALADHAAGRSRPR